MSTADPPALTTEQLADIAAALAPAVAEILRQTAPAIDNELRLYTPEETAPLVGKTANWLRDQVRAGRIPYCRVGKTIMFRASHIRKIQENSEVLPKARSPRRRSAA